MTVALAKAAEIRVDACLKLLARNWERSEGESCQVSKCPCQKSIMLSKFQKSQSALKSRSLGADSSKTAENKSKKC